MWREQGSFDGTSLHFTSLEGEELCHMEAAPEERPVNTDGLSAVARLRKAAGRGSSDPMSANYERDQTTELNKRFNDWVDEQGK